MAATAKWGRSDVRIAGIGVQVDSLALEVAGQRYNIGEKYGLLTAQMALALDGIDREKILAQIVDLLAQRG